LGGAGEFGVGGVGVFEEFGCLAGSVVTWPKKRDSLTADGTRCTRIGGGREWPHKTQKTQKVLIF
jgi:hypothetical protein